jgi:hypothetical protein
MAEEAPTTEAAPEPSQTSDTETPQPQAPDVSEQLQSLREEVFGEIDNLREADYEEEDGLLGYDEAGNPVYAEDEAEQEYDSEEMDPEQALLALIDQRAGALSQQQVNALREQVMQEREQERRQEALSDFATEYNLPKDEQGNVTRETIDAIAAQLAPLAETYGPDIYTNPEAVKRAWFAHLAEQESAAEVPAEEATRAGAFLETGAGPHGGRTSSDDEQIKREIMGAGGPGGDWFRGG